MIALSRDAKDLQITSADENKLPVLSAADLSVKAEVESGDEPYSVAYRR
jgi:hypothetical protein